MEHGQGLFAALAHQVPDTSGVTLGLGDLGTLARVQERLPGMVLVADAAPRRRPRREQLQRVLLGDPMALPLPRGGLDGLIAAVALCRSSSPAALLQAWSQHLRVGAWILVIEPLIRSASLRRLQGLLGGPRFARPPEEICGLLLNAGFAEVAQRVVAERRPSFITSGRWREL
jgi:hypothetical protein